MGQRASKLVPPSKTDLNIWNQWHIGVFVQFARKTIYRLIVCKYIKTFLDFIRGSR